MENNLIDKSTLIKYATNFYGYGSLDNDVWVIGLEEGEEDKNHTISTAHRRINTTLNMLNDQNTICVRESHKIFAPKFYESSFVKGSLKSEYLRNLCRILCAFEDNKDPNIQDVRDYQLNRVGISSTLLEFRPLSSTRLNMWRWNKWVDMPELVNRASYYKWIDPIRRKWFSDKIKKHAPKVVLSFGNDIKNQWNDIFGFNFQDEDAFIHLQDDKQIKVYMRKIENTIYVNAPSPNYRGLKSEYFNWLGKTLNQFSKQ